MKIFLCHLLLILGTCLLSSCLECEHQLSLERDGSGEFELVLISPDLDEIEEGSVGLVSEDGAMAQAKATGVQILENSTTVADGSKVSKLRIAFDDFDDLKAFLKQDGKGEKDFDFRFSLKTSGGETTLRHQVIPHGGDESEDEQALAMISDVLEESYYKMSWVLPNEVLEATDGAEIDGKNVKFKVPMVALLGGSGVDVFAKYQSVGPGWVFFAICGFVAAVLLAGLILVVRRLRR